MDGAPLFAAFKQMQFISARNESHYLADRNVPALNIEYVA